MASNPTLFCNAPLAFLADLALSDDGRFVETEIDILELVPQVQVGGAGKFHADNAKAAEMIRNHQREAALGYLPPFVLGHPRHEDGTPDEAAPAVGWLTGLRQVGTRLRASVRLLKDFAESVARGEYRHVSPEFSFSAHSSTGERIGAKVFRVGVTNTPHQKGADGQPVGAFQLAEMAGAQDSTMAFDPEKACAELSAQVAALATKFEEFSKPKPDAPPAPPAEMSPEDKAKQEEEQAKAMAAKKLTEDTLAAVPVLLSEVKSLSETVSKLSEAHGIALSAKDTEIKSLSEAIADLKTTNLRGDITATVDLAARECKLTPAQVDGYKADPIKWLADSPWAGNLDNLKKFLSSAQPVADTAPRVSHGGGSTKATPVVALSEAQLKAAGLKAEELAEALKSHAEAHGDDSIFHEQPEA